MKHLVDMLNESLALECGGACKGPEEEEVEVADVKKLKKELEDVKKDAEEAKEQADDAEKQAKEADKEANKAEESIKTEKDFRDYAKNKFEIVFGKGKVDEEKMKKIVDGILDKCKDEVKDGKFGTAIGQLNKSFGH